jgi:hypothetical protein
VIESQQFSPSRHDPVLFSPSHHDQADNLKQIQIELPLSKDTEVIPNIKSLVLPSLNFSSIDRNNNVFHSMPVATTKTTADRKDMQVDTLANLSLS